MKAKERSVGYLRILESFPDNSIDLIFTDPPYDWEVIQLYSKLGELAMGVLKPGGSLVTYFGQPWLDQIIEYLKATGLNYYSIHFVKHGKPNNRNRPIHANRIIA